MAAGTGDKELTDLCGQYMHSIKNQKGRDYPLLTPDTLRIQRGSENPSTVAD